MTVAIQYSPLKSSTDWSSFWSPTRRPLLMAKMNWAIHPGETQDWHRILFINPVGEQHAALRVRRGSTCAIRALEDVPHPQAMPRHLRRPRLSGFRPYPLAPQRPQVVGAPPSPAPMLHPALQAELPQRLHQDGPRCQATPQLPPRWALASPRPSHPHPRCWWQLCHPPHPRKHPLDGMHWPPPWGKVLNAWTSCWRGSQPTPGAGSASGSKSGTSQSPGTTGWRGRTSSWKQKWSGLARLSTVWRGTQHTSRIEGIHDAWLPLFQQHMANQQEANQCSQENNRLLHWLLSHYEAEREHQAQGLPTASSPPQAHTSTWSKHGYPTYCR